MKFNAQILFGFAAFALAACSSDEPEVNPVPPVNPDGDVAYMAISISAPEDMGGRSTEDGEDYEPSWTVAKEHEVNSVDFYFFEEDGTYAFSASASTNFDQSTTANGANNVEYIGSKQILILNGVRKNDYPEYVVTVLNKPEGFTPGQTLQETGEILTAYAKGGAFIMTTSSFFGEKVPDATKPDELRHDDDMYFATRLNASDFKLSVNDASTTENPVQIYVERLHAKVQLSFGTEANRYVTYDKEIYYKLSQTLAGGDNQTGEGNQSQVDLYVKVVGWDLSGTAKNSYMSKQLNSDWKTNAPQTDWAWNKEGDWRSFWAKAWTYGLTDGSAAEKLDYVTPKQVVNSTLETQDNLEKPNYTYCFENTNTPANIFAPVAGGSLNLGGDDAAVKNALTTHVVLHTQIYQYDGTKMELAGELVQYRGVLYTGESYKNLLLNRIKNGGNLNFWTKVGSQNNAGTITNDWQTIDDSFLVINADSIGKHKLGQIKVSATTPADAEVYYYDSEKKDYVKYETAAAFEADLNTALAAVVDTENPAVGSNENADNFYWIPIEHHASAKERNAVEGYYGVVRNHWYKLTVTSFKKVGHLIFDPANDETKIVPDGPEDPLYYVGAKINILSWKVVNQTASDL